MGGGANHPVRPMSPKNQPHPFNRRNHSADRSAPSGGHCPVVKSVHQDVLYHTRIEQRAFVKLQKFHETLAIQRNLRKLQREKSGDLGQVVKALQVQSTSA